MSAATTSKVALITGGGFGIGRAIALSLARAGCDIGVIDLDPDAAAETCRLVAALDRNAALASGSVADRPDVIRCVAELHAALGPVDVLVNNAGILRTAPFLDTTDADWRAVFAVNLDGVFHVSQAVLPSMVARSTGVVINMSSWTGKKGVPNHSAYAASKAAVIALTQSLAGEMAANGIRINAVCPGVIVDTRMRDEAEALNRQQGLPDVATRARAIPLQRPGTPDDVARVVTFLASDDASYMTGQAINITGGLWMS